jgi:tetratricopeptide (TPR) repeat protein
MIEVSHDQLAKRIAERRSADSKVIALVQRLVRDRLAGYEQTKTFLAAEELAKVQPVLPQLGLSPAETDFVEKSRKKIRLRRLQRVIGTAGLIAVLAGFSAYAGFQSERASSAITAASETTGIITSRIATDLKVIEKTQRVRKSLLDDLKSLNSELEAIDPLATADTGFWLAILEGDLLLEDNDIPRARQKFVAALGAAETQDIPDAATVSPWRRNVAAGASRLAQLELTDGKPDAALKYFLKALAIDEANARALPADMFAQHDLLLSYGNFGSFQRERGRLDSARAYLGKALAIARRLDAADPDNRDWQRDYGFYLHELGKVEGDSGNLDKARTALTAAVKRYDAIADADPARLDWRLDSMWASYDLANVERRAGRWSEALRASDAAYTSLDALSQDSQTEYGQILKDQRDLIDQHDSRVAAPAGNPA